MKKKAINLSYSASAYMEIARGKLKNEEYPDAIYYFYKAYSSGGDIDALLELGRVYLKIMQYDEAQKYLFRALDQDNDCDAVYKSLVRLFLELDAQDEAFFYMTKGMTKDEYDYILEQEQLIYDSETPIKLLEKDDNAMLSVATKLLKGGDHKYAREILTTIPKTSPDYSEANNLLAIVELSDGKPETDKVLTYCENALAYGENVGARCNMLVAYNIMGDLESEHRVRAHLEGMTNLTIADYKKIAISYLRISDADMVARYMGKILELNSFGRDDNVSYALALYNSGDYLNAKKIMLRAAKLYPDDEAITVFLQKMYAGEKLSLFPTLGSEYTLEVIKYIDERFKKIKNDKQLKTALKDKQLSSSLLWLYQSKLVPEGGVISDYLMGDKHWQQIFKGFLLDPAYDISSKKMCLYSLLKYSGERQFGIVLDGYYTKLNPKYPFYLNTLFFSAFCHAYSTLAFIESCFEDKLYRVVCRFYKTYLAKLHVKTEITDDITLAAAMFSCVNPKNVPAEFSHEIFGCEKTDLDKYIDLFKKNSGKPKLKKTQTEEVSGE